MTVEELREFLSELPGHARVSAGWYDGLVEIHEIGDLLNDAFDRLSTLPDTAAVGALCGVLQTVGDRLSSLADVVEGGRPVVGFVYSAAGVYLVLNDEAPLTLRQEAYADWLSSRRVVG